MKLYKQAHAAYQCSYHIVWITRYRRKILVPGVAECFEAVIKEVRKFHPDWHVEEVGTDLDHVHLYMVVPPRYAVSAVVAALKANTGSAIRKKFSHFLAKVYWDGGGIWGRGFFVSTVGVNEATIRAYVRYQGKQEEGQAFRL